jgi:hypothetical protein
MGTLQEQNKNKNKNRVKGSGQECSLYTSDGASKLENI